jgi:hypothetical protein
MVGELDDQRLSIARGSMTVGQRATRLFLVLVATLPITVACSSTPPPTSTPPSSDSESIDLGSPSATEPTETLPAYDPTRITQVCESWGGHREELTITCGKGIAAALDSLGDEAGAVERVELRYTPPCSTPATCPPRRQDHAWVTIHSGLIEDRIVELTLPPGLEITAAPPGIDSAPRPVPSFGSPPLGRAAIGPPIPGELRDRKILPLCGVEHADSGGPWNTEARRCFRDSVLSGLPAEFLTEGFGTEGGNSLTLYRFLGRGAITRFDREAGTWTSTACGITILRTDVVFATDGVCRRGPLTR